MSVHDARSASGARALAQTHGDADLFLLDLGLPGTDGFTLLAELRHHHPGLPVVVLSGSDRRDDVLRAIDLGAMGFIHKTSSPQVMLSALRLVLSGGVYLPPLTLASGGTATLEHASLAPAQTGASALVPLDLTERQAQVLALMLQGKPNKLICRELDLAEGTVKIHVAAILRTLNVHTRTQAVIEASRLGLRIEDLLARGERR